MDKIKKNKTKKSSNSCVDVGGAGVHVQPDCWNWRSDDAPGLRHRWLGGELGAHRLPGIYEVNVVDVGLGKTQTLRFLSCAIPGLTESSMQRGFNLNFAPQLC